MAVLRQELDSMVRCVFLLSVSDRRYRKRLLEDSVNGRPWRTEDGSRKITDRDSWTQNVYAFGCGLSIFQLFTITRIGTLLTR